jgi:imidazolonepropionase
VAIILKNIGTLATCRAAGPQNEIHAIRAAALVWEGGEILWIGPERDLPGAFADAECWDAGGRLVVPGLVDCHTHLAFGGDRADEFEQRCLGTSYQAIARAGGGIASTVGATRGTSEADLQARAAGYLREMVQLGVTTVEAKSGYGLNLDTERKLLAVYRHLGQSQPVRIVPTFLGAHVVAPEYRDDRSGYVDLIIDEMIPSVAAQGLAKFCDVFVEEGAFTVDEARRILQAGRRVGLESKLHADQLAAGGGAELAAEVGAVSADHLEYITEAGIEAIKASGTVAVSLPLATMYLKQTPMPARRLMDAGVSVAVATDFNPGSAPNLHLPLAMTIACVLQGMSPAESLKGATIIAARAVGAEARVGSLEPGKAADFALIDAADVNDWLYLYRPNACRLTVIAGKTCWQSPEGLA